MASVLIRHHVEMQPVTELLVLDGAQEPVPVDTQRPGPRHDALPLEQDVVTFATPHDGAFRCATNGETAGRCPPGRFAYITSPRWRLGGDALAEQAGPPKGIPGRQRT
jgi:hypothetical protein